MRIARGDVSEWLKEAVLKTVDVKASVGSNPTISAIFSIIARGNTQVAIRGSPAKGVDGVKPCVGSNPTFRAMSPRASNRSRRLYILCIQNHRSSSPLRLFPEKDLARFTCSLESAFTTILSRYQPFSDKSFINTRITSPETLIESAAIFLFSFTDAVVVHRSFTFRKQFGNRHKPISLRQSLFNQLRKVIFNLIAVVMRENDASVRQLGKHCV